MKAKRHEVLMMSDLQSGAQTVRYVTDADAGKLESEIETLRVALKRIARGEPSPVGIARWAIQWTPTIEEQLRHD